MATPIRKVLVPIDFSDVSSLAVRYGASLAGAFGAELTVMTVADDDAEWVVDLSDRVHVKDRWREERVREGERKLEDFCATLIGDVDCTFSVRVGDPTDEILATCREVGGDMLVMGAHGATGVVADWLGGTAYKVSKRAPCPVLIVKHPS